MESPHGDSNFHVQVLETQALAEETSRLEAEVAGLRRLVEQADQLAQMPRIAAAFADVAAALHLLQGFQQAYEEQASTGSNGRNLLEETLDAAAGLSACASRLAELAEGFRVSSDLCCRSFCP